MKFLTDEKLVISGAGGMIGSNMAQTAIMMGLTSNICLYDVYMPGLEGVVEELRHCSFPGVNITYTDKVEEAFTGAKYMVSSGGAPRKAGMTREDLLVGNANIAAQLGKDIKQPPKPPPIMREPVTPHSSATVAKKSSSSHDTS